MGVFLAEIVKLKRSMSWAVVILLPLVLAAAGSAATLSAGGDLEDGWHTLWLRSVVFYGLFPLAVGIGILGSLVWRVEHRGSNWNALMSNPRRALSIVAAKASAIAVLAAAMQGVMLVAVVAIGKFLFGLPGMLPGQYVAISAMIALASVPVAALQSGLSMVMRSFAGSVAVAFLGSAVSAVLVVAKAPGIVFVSPYALLSRVTQLGTAAFADERGASAPLLVSLILAAVFLTAVCLFVEARVLEHNDTRT